MELHMLPTMLFLGHLVTIYFEEWKKNYYFIQLIMKANFGA